MRRGKKAKLGPEAAAVPRRRAAGAARERLGAQPCSRLIYTSGGGGLRNPFAGSRGVGGYFCEEAEEKTTLIFSLQTLPKGQTNEEKGRAGNLRALPTAHSSAGSARSRHPGRCNPFPYPFKNHYGTSLDSPFPRVRTLFPNKDNPEERSRWFGQREDGSLCSTAPAEDVCWSIRAAASPARCLQQDAGNTKITSWCSPSAEQHGTRIRLNERPQSTL